MSPVIAGADREIKVMIIVVAVSAALEWICLPVLVCYLKTKPWIKPWGDFIGADPDLRAIFAPSRSVTQHSRTFCGKPV